MTENPHSPPGSSAPLTQLTGVSEAKRRANCNNAQHSTGPVTPAGVERSSKNAVKTGLTGQTVLLPADDPELYRLYIQRQQAELKPVGELETQLVQRIADAQWRLNRIPVLEQNLYKLGRRQFATLFEDELPDDRAELIQAHTSMAFQTQFKNLSIQETRIRRGYTQDLNELKSLQSQRGKLKEDDTLLAKWPAPWPGGRKTGFEFAKADQEAPCPEMRLIIGPRCEGDAELCARLQEESRKKQDEEYLAQRDSDNKEA